jgi:DNA/RNA endonuclease YhcR with UshA esterase domain
MKEERTQHSMLTEKMLIIASVTISLVGLCALFIILQSAELPANQLSVINDTAARADVRVHVSATIASVRYVGNNTITQLRLSETIERDAVVFSRLNLTKGQKIIAEGDVQEYNGAYELIVRKLEVVK